MYFAAASLLQGGGQQTLPVTEALSGIFGSISLTAWICLLLPQLAENYKAKSAKGLSMNFLFIWLAGDVANLIGALFTQLAPTAIALASYFCFADIVLILQCIYYNSKEAAQLARLEREAANEQVANEDSPLLNRRRSSSSIGLPGSHRRRDTHTESSIEPIRKVITGEDETKDSKPVLHNTLALLAVHLVGFAGWFVSYKAGAWDNEHGEDDAPQGPGDAENTMQWIGLILGYVSAVLYLCARLPQIYKNYAEKSCEGLSLLFFMLSMLGNLTYGISLVAYSQDKGYLITTIPWLIGSLGTIAEDIVVFIQFRLYADNIQSSAITA